MPAAAGAALSGGSADLALIPRTTSPFLSESRGLVLGPARARRARTARRTGRTTTARTFDSLVTKASQQLNPGTPAATDYTAADLQLWDDLVALPLFTEPRRWSGAARSGE